MGQIHELSDILADQIAAGEVVERPASVVKELVENAIDAKSTQIDVTVEDAGLTTIKVSDNGIGILHDDVKLAFRRHATSKINSRTDLFKVKTLGFRGEALPSIVSVADVTLQTANKTELEGTAIHIKGGEIKSTKPCASRVGTTITVRDLFFNTPARLKYLSSLPTELANISDIINRLALSHTDIAFSLSNNGKVLIKTAGNGNLQQVIGTIYGISSARQMVSFNGKDLDFTINGFISLPKLTRASRNYISLLINGRYIKNYKLTKALIAGYGSKLMVGRYPFAVVNIQLDPLLVDVNVHPTKQEVRISKEDELSELLTQSIAQRLEQENLIPNGLLNLNSKKRESFDFKQLEVNLNETANNYKAITTDTDETRKAVNNALLGVDLEAVSEKVSLNNAKPIMITDKKQLLSSTVKSWDKKYQAEKVNLPKAEVTLETSEKQGEEATEVKAERFPTLRYIGQMHGTYLLAENEAGLYIVDQHAAQERIKYEYYRREIGKVGISQQSLLIPIVLSYPTPEALKIEEHLPDLKELGIVLEDFGKNTYIVHQHPAWFKQGQESDIIKEMIDFFLQDKNLTVAKFREKTAIMMSCKRSIKANHHLDDKQAEDLLQQLKECENPFNCPHGRPTVITLSPKDLEHMFKRIQDPHQSLESEL